MSKWANDAIADLILNYVRSNCDRMIACSQQPTTYAEATSTYALATVTMTVNTDYTLADGTVDGRKITVAAKSANVSVLGTATHVALVKTGDSTLRFVTTCDSQALTAGGTVDFPTWIISVADPYFAGGNGPLTVSAVNSRYFTDGNGKAILLAGAFTWYSLRDAGGSYPAPAFDYTAYLDSIQANGQNYTRIFAWEQFYLTEHDSRSWYIGEPHVYPRTGPGNANDGRLKFDLSQFNQLYFDRLRQRVILAGQRGLYCMVQLFQGFSVKNKGYSPGFNVWPGHPYHTSNNINSINGDQSGNGDGSDIQTLLISAVTTLQAAYVDKVIDTLNDLDNVLYEICNESDGSYSVSSHTGLEWQNHWIDHIHTYEASKPKKHPVLFSVQWPSGDNADLFASNAECISPNGYTGDSTPNDGSKVILADTDHIFFPSGDADWAWKMFTRGHNPCFMDTYSSYDEIDDTDPTTFENLRDNLGWILGYARRADLNTMTPDNTTFCSTTFCLKGSLNNQYICYQPSSGNFTLDLSAASGTFTIEWFRPSTGTTQSGGTTTGGATRTLTPPWTPAIAYAYK